MSAFSPQKNRPPQRTPSSTPHPIASAQPISFQRQPILNLQRTIGNQAVLRSLQIGSKPGGTASTGAMEGPGQHGFADNLIFSPPIKSIQPKLTVNMPGDAYEQEADRVAEQVMRMPESPAPATVSGSASGMQRACDCGGSCDDCKKSQDEHAKVQMKAAGPMNTGMDAPPIVHEVLRSSGQPLDRKTRDFMEPRFGQDFSGVRVHTDAKAVESAKAVGARAYTVGSNVVFGAGEYGPSTHAGQRLLGHELAHVVQQGSVPTQLRRDIKNDAAGNAVAFEFRVGIELRQSFVELAQKLALAGPIMDGDLEDLRTQALKFHGTVDDRERMFMAGLLDSANVASLRRMAIAPGASITFTFATITNARVQHIIDLGRETVPESVAKPAREGADALKHLKVGDALEKAAESESAAGKAILANAGEFKAQATALVNFARSHGVSLGQMLQAILAAASDSSAGDKVLAGTAFAIADDAGSSVTGDLLSGRIKVDALIPAAFGRLSIPAGTVAFYVTAAQKSGMKGDTIYLQTSLNIADLKDRSDVIHELRHAEEDKAASPTAAPSFPVKNQMELRAYRAQAHYILGQMLRQAAPDQARSASEAAKGGGLVLGALVLEGQTDVARFQPALELVFGAAPAPFTQTPAQVRNTLAVPAARIEAAVLQDIDTAYGLTRGEKGVVEGLAGESLIHWIFRI